MLATLITFHVTETSTKPSGVQLCWYCNIVTASGTNTFNNKLNTCEWIFLYTHLKHRYICTVLYKSCGYRFMGNFRVKSYFVFKILMLKLWKTVQSYNSKSNTYFVFESRQVQKNLNKENFPIIVSECSISTY